jgi:hypothetical protein
MYNSFELFFFWRKAGMVAVVGMNADFFACGWIETVVLKKQHCESRVDCKKCDRKKNNRRVDCAEACKKTVQAMRYEW